jgi:hypothetical protein
LEMPRMLLVGDRPGDDVGDMFSSWCGGVAGVLGVRLARWRGSPPTGAPPPPGAVADGVGWFRVDVVRSGGVPRRKGVTSGGRGRLSSAASRAFASAKADILVVPRMRMMIDL